MSWKKKDKPGFLKSIRARLVLGYTLILFVSIAAVSVYFSFQMRLQFLELTKQYLISELRVAIEGLDNESDNEISMSDFLSRYTQGMKRSHKIGYALFDSKGLIVARSKGFVEDKDSLRRTSLAYKNTKASMGNLTAAVAHERLGRNADNNTVYLATQPFQDKNNKIFYLQFGVTPTGQQEAVGIFLKTAILMIPLVILVGFLSGLILTSQFLSPVSKLTKASNEIIYSDTNQELPIRGTHDELDNLAGSFNNVLKKLRQAYQRITVFTANASHEIRLPITAIKGEAEVVLERGRDIEEYKDVMENIVIEMDRLTAMINRLLYLSREDSGSDRLDMERVELKDLLSKMVEFYRVLAEKKNISLSFQAEDMNFYLQADCSRLKELFSNLIENAIRYTPENGSVTLNITKQQDEYAIAVSDTGIGIPKEEHEKIFERFYRIDKSRSREDGGAGLGLSIAAMIAKAHHGRIVVESQLQQGSVFTVFLPN